METQNENQVEKIEVKTETKQGFTQKTMKAFTEQGQRAIKDGLIKKEEMENVLQKIRTTWIAKNL